MFLFSCEVTLDFIFNLVSKTGAFLCLNSFRAFHIVMAQYVLWALPKYVLHIKGLLLGQCSCSKTGIMRFAVIRSVVLAPHAYFSGY